MSADGVSITCRLNWIKIGRKIQYPMLSLHMKKNFTIRNYRTNTANICVSIFHNLYSFGDSCINGRERKQSILDIHYFIIQHHEEK